MIVLVSSNLLQLSTIFHEEPKKNVLILCTGNSCRSHMAEGILRQAADDLVEVHSVGSKPTGYVHPMAIEALREIGIDISGPTSKHLNEFLNSGIDTVITVCDHADETCPVFPGNVNRHHWGSRIRPRRSVRKRANWRPSGASGTRSAGSLGPMLRDGQNPLT